MLAKVAQEIRNYVESMADIVDATKTVGNVINAVSDVGNANPPLAATKPKPKPRLDTATFDDTIKMWRLVDPVGYMRLYGEKPTPRNYFKYEYEHRKVLAEALGRALLRNEIVHHKDSNKINNVPENLELILDHIAHMQQHPEWRIRKNK